MAGNIFSFNNDVTIKVHTHDNVPMTRYAEFIEYLNDEKPILMLNGEFVGYETDDSGWHQADKKYACRVEVGNEKLMHALACAGMMRSGISTYEIEADKSKKFFRMTFRRMW